MNWERMIQLLFAVVLLIGLVAIFILPFSIVVTGPVVVLSSVVLIVLWRVDI